MKIRRTDLLADRHERLRARHPGLLAEQTRQKVAIVGDATYLQTFAGQVTWATSVNLIGRLYKGVNEIRVVVDADIERLSRVFFPNDAVSLKAASLNLLQELSERQVHYAAPDAPEQDEWDDSWVVLYVGRPQCKAKHSVTVAGNGWLAFVNSDAWTGLAPELNPIGPMIAACQGTTEVYKKLYTPKNSFATPLQRSIFSGFDYRFHPDIRDAGPPMPATVEFPLTHIAGSGAGGMAVVLLLDSLPVPVASEGIWLVDRDHFDATNFNRGVLALPKDEGKRKAEIAVQRVDAARLGLQPFYGWWQEFVEQPGHGAQENFGLVVSCVDRYEARRAVQYDRMPRLILTAGTGDFLLTVSRHQLDGGLSCAVCYQSRQPVHPRCGEASDATQKAFEAAIEPSIGFVSVLAGVMLGVELLKEIVPSWRGGRLRNAVRYQLLSHRSKILERPKEAGCGCTSSFAEAAYRKLWGVNVKTDA